ncbi:efflux RND transporter permease subunit [Garciella nitratireducens]|uniref:efflux RND transporter permease subunit n=1 Tax=Garciella nitratireducens TaxID=218205 RepID=UPI001BD5ECDB|nr:MMPL family transporter [Garciella nitratireducens]
MKRFGMFISKHKIMIIIVALLLVIPATLGAMITPINYDILSYLPQDLDSMLGQNILDKTFSNAATSMLILEDVQSNETVKIKDKISQIDGVERVLWINDLVDTNVPKEFLPDDVKDLFYRENSTLMFIQFKESPSSEATQEAIETIRKTIDKESYLAGLSAIVKDTRDLADKETPIYVLLAVILCLLVLMISIESYLVPFIFIFSIGLSILYNLGTNIFLGEISYITKSLVAILQLGVTMDYSIFLLHRYDEEKQSIEDRNEAMAQAIAKTFSSITGSSITTIAGFLALCTMSLAIGKDMGLVMAKGVFIGVLSTITILPAFILVFDKPIHKYKHKTLLPGFEKTAFFVTKHYKVLAVLFILIFIPALYGQGHTKVYYNLDESLPKDLPSIVSTNKLKNDYNMTTTHFIVINDKFSSHQVKNMVEEIKKVDGIENVLSYDNILGPGIPESFVPNEIRDFSMKDGYKLILANSNYKSATDEANHQIDKLNDIVKRYDKDGMVTGEGALTKDLVILADRDFKTSSMFSMLSIFAIIMFVLSSLSVPIILVACVELAIFINMAIPFYTGTIIPFIASIVIGCIQLGATVDYAILLTTRFREEIRNGLDKIHAMEVAIQGSARSIITSALSFFAATIGVGLISKMEMVKSLCVMLSRGAMISMVVVLFILPSILLISEKVIEITSRNWKEKGSFKLKIEKEENNHEI